jgi:hypothetical protein
VYVILKLGKEISQNWVLLVVIGIAVTVIGWFLHTLRNSEELQGKPLYSDLQGIELTHRGVKLSEPVVVLGDPVTGTVIGVPTDDPRFPNAWIATSKFTSDGKPYVVISGAVKLTCQQVDTLMSKRELKGVAPGVRLFLAQHCN